MSNEYDLIAPLRMVLLAALCLGLTCTAASKQGEAYGDLSEDPPLRLELGLKVYKKTCLLREPIRVRVSVTNIGEHKGKFGFITGEGLVIRDSKGTDYPSNLHVGRTGLSEIQAGETMEEEVNISAFCYGVPHNQKWKVYWYLPPEKYTISYRLNQTGVSGGKLEAESAVDTFEVVEPQGEDARALDLLLRSYDLRIEKKHQESRQKLHELLEKYPESGYVPYVTLMAANTLEKWHEVIRRSPKSGEAIAAVKSIALHFINKKDKQGYIQAMNDLIKNYPNTDIASEAQSRLNNISDRYFRHFRKPSESDPGHQEEDR